MPSFFVAPMLSPIVLLALLATFAAIPLDTRTGLTCDEVDSIELSHVYDNEGNLILDQCIFHERTEAGFRIRAWRLDKGAKIQRHPSGDYMLLWHDGQVLREVRSKLFRESWSQHDPELRERSTFPKDLRRELTTRRDEPDELDLILP